MSKRTTFTSISPLPAGISRELVLSTLHNHAEMIDLNPLVIERHQIPPPPNAEPDEVEAGCAWWSMTDEISYMPGLKSDLTYTAAFQDLKDGMRTHCYAPMGTHIRGRWSLGGTLPGEPAEPVELGLVGVPAQGLYLREDVDLRCNFLMAGFVKKTILKSHGVLVDRLVSKASGCADAGANTSISSPSSRASSIGAAAAADRRRRHHHQSGAPVSPMSPPPTGGQFQDRVSPYADAQQPAGRNSRYDHADNAAAAPRSNSTHNDHRSALRSSHASSDASTPPPPPQQEQQQQQQQRQSQKTAANGGGGGGGGGGDGGPHPFYSEQRAAGSEMGPESAANVRHSAMQPYSSNGSSSSNNNNNNDDGGGGEQALQHKSQHQYSTDQAPQIPPLDELLRDRRARGDDDALGFAAAFSGGVVMAVPGCANGAGGVPVAELRGGEARIPELQ